MRSTIIAAAASLLAIASARTVGFSAPETVKPGSDIDIKILQENYIQTVNDVAFSFGLQASNQTYPDSLGTYLESLFFCPDEGNTAGTDFQLTIPANTAQGNYILNGTLFSLTGAENSPVFTNFAAKISVGASTSSNYVNATQLS